MRNRVSTKLSGFASASLLVVLAFAISAPSAYAQIATRGPRVTTAPARVVDQLLSMVEKQMVPLAEAMPANKYNFAPTQGEYKGVSTFADQLRHVIHANYTFFSDAASMKPSIPNPANLESKDEIVQALKGSFAFAHQAVATLTPDSALETVKPEDGVDTRAGIMIFALIHMNDHYGQLVEYLRMNGIVPPASRHSAPPATHPQAAR